MLDLRSARCVQLQQSADYTKLLATAGPAKTAAELNGVKPDELFSKPVTDIAAASAALAALWLLHDDLDAAHEIVQQSPADLRRGAGKSLTVLTAGQTGSRDDHMMTATLSFWHAIIHRREGDFGNAKYWYARCRDHELLPSLGEQFRGTIAHAPADKSLMKLAFNDYNGSAFVDLIQEVHESPSDERHAIAVALQQLEWRVLFDYCTRLAVA